MLPKLQVLYFLKQIISFTDDLMCRIQPLSLQCPLHITLLSVNSLTKYYSIEAVIPTLKSYSFINNGVKSFQVVLF